VIKKLHVSLQNAAYFGCMRQPLQGFTFQKYVTKGHYTAVAIHSTVKRLVFAVESVATAV